MTDVTAAPVVEAEASTATSNTSTATLEKKAKKSKAPKPAKAAKAVKAPAEKKAPKPAKLTPEQLKAEEDRLRAKYSDQTIVKGSIADIGAQHDLRGELVPKKFREWNKRSVEIKCQWPGCKEIRRVATSDLQQVKYCEAHTIEARRARRKELRKGKPKKAKAKAK